VQTFVLCPLVVVLFETSWQDGRPLLLPGGMPFMAWGYLQYQLVGRYRIVRAGGGPGMETMPERLLEGGPYRYTRNPMYLGHLIFMAGLAVTLWSWLALILFVARAAWFQSRVWRDEHRLELAFGPAFGSYRARVKRWIPFLF
jgi:protein-S-isoprenylcysteine O-methyltransferase Ste14